MWWGVAIYSFINLPWAWWLVVGAIANTLLFLVVSIPMADGRQSKKEGFIEYKRQTRALLPIYKRQG
jgi:steroid 5-alpha reductase family enzyme